MRYALARYIQHQRDVAYRIYVTDCLRILTENTANMCEGSYISERYADIVNPKAVDNRSGEEVVADIIQRAGIEVIY